MKSATCAICRGTSATDHTAKCPNRAVQLVDPAAVEAERYPGMVRVTRQERDAARDAAANASTLQRLIDLQHLRAAVTHTDQGPAVLWHDIARLMPLPDDATGTVNPHA